MEARGEVAGRGRRLLLWGAGLSAALLFVPDPYYRYVAWPLMLLSTYAHEMGHGVAALLSGGAFESFRMWPDGSGVAMTATGGRLSAAFVSAGGLIGPACLAAVLLALSRRGRLAHLGLYVLGALFWLSALLVVRNAFGLVFVGVAGAACLFIAQKTSSETTRFALIFIAAQLALSVFTRGDYLFTDTAVTSGGVMPSDVARISEALFAPYWFWGALCGAFSVAVLLAGLWLLWRGGARPAPARPLA
jgi:hypothetical protein